MISNSVPHLWSYTYTAIARNSALILPETPCQYHRKLRSERQCRRAERRCLRIGSLYLCIQWPVFHDVPQCFTEFSGSRNDRHRCIDDRAAADNAAEIGDNAAGIGDIAAKVIP